MAQIAIKGHSKRGKEVIEILESMGGKNTFGLSGDASDLYYFIDSNNKISYTYTSSTLYKITDFKIFTVEEFREKYPYKVGDKVTVTGLPEYPKIINFMEWFDGDIHYSFDNETWFLPSELNLYKEEIMEVKRMAQLAIRGHATRGEEVIEILEMLGGKNSYEYSGDCIETHYYIANEIYSTRISPINKNIFMCFTLEKFLEKFPYKVGDRVRIPEYESEVCINKMLWDGNEVLYEVVVDDEVEQYSAEELNEFNEPNKEETMEERKYADLRLDVDQDDKLATEVTIDGGKIIPPENYLIGKVTTVDNGLLVEFVKKQSQLPKTYAECCDVFSISPYYNLKYHTNEYGYHDYTKINKLCSLRDKLNTLSKLLICRDAYWKIAGEQMGLGRPWKPDWNDSVNIKWIIGGYKNKIVDDCNYYIHNILAFPTEEMRVTFNENFKELIEVCRDFL